MTLSSTVTTNRSTERTPEGSREARKGRTASRRSSPLRLRRMQLVTGVVALDCFVYLVYSVYSVYFVCFVCLV